MHIEFSTHAIDQIRIRSITRTRILSCIRRPDKTVPSFRGRTLYQKDFQEHLLEVVTAKEDNKIIVITAYHLEKS